MLTKKRTDSGIQAMGGIGRTISTAGKSRELKILEYPMATPIETPQ